MATTRAAQNIQKSKQWLTENVYPLWLSKGVDSSRGGFRESISFSAQAMDVPRRAMVQARQIYSFHVGFKLGCCRKEEAIPAIMSGVRYLVEQFSLPSGAFMHSINVDGSPKSINPDLYTQAFAIFGLAQAYAINANPEYKARAKAVIKYLQQERKVSGGGYTEIDDSSVISYKSNPHMHLFEAAIAWMQIDNDQDFKDLGHELITLCLNKFIDSETHVLGEYFDEKWNHIKESGNFIYEPGHQYEWAWLMSLYQDLTGQDLKEVRHQLFQLAEQYGISAPRKVVYDEMWSNYTPKTQSSRFWPQCERIKAAVRLGSEVSSPQKEKYMQAADEALETLFRFFETPVNGLWFDVLSADDKFNASSAKASSLYHIVNAMDEYIHFNS